MLRNGIWDINKSLIWVLHWMPAVGLCLRAEVSSLSEGARRGRLGRASPGREFAQKHAWGQEQPQKDWFPPNRAGVRQRPLSITTSAAGCQLWHQRLLSGYVIASARKPCCTSRSTVIAAQKKSLLWRTWVSEILSTALEAEAVTCANWRSRRWLSRSSQGGQQGGASAGAERALHPSWLLPTAATRSGHCSDRRRLSCRPFPALHLQASPTRRVFKPFSHLPGATGRQRQGPGLLSFCCGLSRAPAGKPLIRIQLWAPCHQKHQCELWEESERCWSSWRAWVSCFKAGGETDTQGNVTLKREDGIWTGIQSCSTGYRAKPVYLLSPF